MRIDIFDLRHSRASLEDINRRVCDLLLNLKTGRLKWPLVFGPVVTLNSKERVENNVPKRVVSGFQDVLGMYRRRSEGLIPPTHQRQSQWYLVEYLCEYFDWPDAKEKIRVVDSLLGSLHNSPVVRDNAAFLYECASILNVPDHAVIGARTGRIIVFLDCSIVNDMGHWQHEGND